MRVSLLLVSICAALLAPISPAAEPYKNTTWEALVPKDWDPAKEFKSLNLGAMQDSDPRAMEALTRMKDTWSNAPTERSMDGVRIKISGFAIPLEMKGDKVTEFLLVPYFGACIHTPPPPSNQVIHVLPRQAAKGFHSMDTVWVTGTLKTLRSDTAMGTSSYRLDAVSVEPYVDKPK